MSLRFAILSLLTRESLTGYDLTKRFETTVGFFWSAKHSQIYPELALLTKEGLVTFEVVSQASKPSKKVYTLTDAGHKLLAAWVAEEADRRNTRDPVLMRIWSLGTVPPHLALPQLRGLLRELDEKATQLEAVRTSVPDAASPSTTDEHLGARLVLDFGARHYASYRGWVIDTIARLEDLAPQEAGA